MRSKLRKFGFYLIFVVFGFVATLFVGELGVTVYHIVRDASIFPRGIGSRLRRTLTSRRLERRQTKAAAMAIA